MRTESREGRSRPWRLEELHGEDDATAGTEADAAAPHHLTPHIPAGNTGSQQGGTVARNDDMDGRETEGMGYPPRGRQTLRGGHHNHDRKGHGWSSTRPGRERERER